MALSNIKAPGVYIEEIALLPPSIAQVATAIPAFVGYTEKAVSPEGKDLQNVAVKISSFLQFRSLFGNAFQVPKFTVSVNAGNVVTAVQPDRRFYMCDCLRQFFDNGGGECYIVSVGGYDAAPAGATIGAGIELLKKYDEPTLILFPDAVALRDGGNNPDYTALADLQTQALAICAKMQDRFAVLDLMEGNLQIDSANKPIETFRDKIGINFLSYGAAYYPWIVTNYEVAVDYRLMDFGAVNLNNVSRNAGELAMLNAVKSLVDGSGALAQTDIIATLGTLDKNKVRTEGTSFIVKELNNLKKAIEDAPTKEATKTAVSQYFILLNSIALSFAKMETDLPANAPLLKDILLLKRDKTLTDALKGLISFEKHKAVTDNTDAEITAAKIKNDIFPPLFAGGANGWLALPLTGTDDIPAFDNPAITLDKPGVLALISRMETNEKVIPGLLHGYAAALSAASYYETGTQRTLFSQHAFFKGVADLLTETMRTIPPSGSVVGVYATTDRVRGVWKAPANVSLNGVIGPAVKLDNKDQDGLNVDPSGKSINAIRAFTGKGTILWGARTLAGNDNEWRYISVRRFFNMVEESCKKASEPMVFEPNDANTWIKVKVMIENFLTLQWRDGALQGAKPEHAFFVHVGLGETMTADDVLNGRMIVEIGMAVVRPAEFIVLRFSHKMMEQ